MGHSALHLSANLISAGPHCDRRSKLGSNVGKAVCCMRSEIEAPFTATVNRLGSISVSSRNGLGPNANMGQSSLLQSGRAAIVTCFPVMPSDLSSSIALMIASRILRGLRIANHLVYVQLEMTDFSDLRHTKKTS